MENETKETSNLETKEISNLETKETSEVLLIKNNCIDTCRIISEELENFNVKRAMYLELAKKINKTFKETNDEPVI